MKNVLFDLCLFTLVPRKFISHLSVKDLKIIGVCGKIKAFSISQHMWTITFQFINKNNLSQIPYYFHLILFWLIFEFQRIIIFLIKTIFFIISKCFIKYIGVKMSAFVPRSYLMFSKHFEICSSSERLRITLQKTLILCLLWCLLTFC